jgi:hypothetical protein
MTMTPQQSTPSLSMSLFGITDPTEEDNLPTVVFQGVHRTKNLRIPTSVSRIKKPKPVVVPTLGHSISYPEPPVEPEEVTPDELLDDIIEVDIPDDYYDRHLRSKQTPEKPSYDVIGDNEFEVPDELITEIQQSTTTREELLRQVLFEQASLLYAYDDASNFVEAVMCDGLEMEVEMDRDILPEAFVPLSRLSVLSTFIDQCSLSDQVKKTLMGRLTVRTADEMVVAMNKRKAPEALAALHKQYAATVTRSGLPPDAEAPQNTVGVRASRK